MTRSIQEIQIRRSQEDDRSAIAEIHSSAFGKEEGPEIVDLVEGLFNDPTAKPLLSLVAEVDGRVVGHILFTSARLKPTDVISTL